MFWSTWIVWLQVTCSTYDHAHCPCSDRWSKITCSRSIGVWVVRIPSEVSVMALSPVLDIDCCIKIGVKEQGDEGSYSSSNKIGCFVPFFIFNYPWWTMGTLFTMMELDPCWQAPIVLWLNTHSTIRVAGGCFPCGFYPSWNIKWRLCELFHGWSCPKWGVLVEALLGLWMILCWNWLIWLLDWGLLVGGSPFKDMLPDVELKELYHL